MNINKINYWILLQYKVNSHKKAAKHLKNQGFEIFLPFHEITKRKQKTFVKELRPLFPGYMFVNLTNKSKSLKSINSTIGVSRIVSFGNNPAIVPNDLISELALRCDKMGKIMPLQNFIVGKKVEVINGPFTNFIGTIENIETNQRLYLLLNYMGQKTRIKVQKNDIENFIV